jgi:hypothetical protein
VAYKYSLRGRAPVSLIALHSAEGARTAKALGNYFYRDDVQASSHVGIDAYATLQYVPPQFAAWTLRSGNPISENAELCAFARWTRAQWLSMATVDGCAAPRLIVSRAAAWARSRALARGIPLKRLTPVQVGQGAWGLIDHHAWTIGKRDGSHTDVGGGFPWDVFLAEVLGTTKQEDDVSKPFQDLLLAREEDVDGSTYPKVFVGNGVTCRHVANEQDLENLRYRIRMAGGNDTVQEGWAKGTLFGVLGVEVKAVKAS